LEPIFQLCVDETGRDTRHPVKLVGLPGANLLSTGPQPPEGLRHELLGRDDLEVAIVGKVGSQVRVNRGRHQLDHLNTVVLELLPQSQRVGVQRRFGCAIDGAELS
jgi:hypothetical protein